MRKIKTVVVFLLICCSLVTMVPRTLAETSYSFEPEAWQLHRLGLFSGASASSFNADLGAKLNRQIGVTLLLNFFGKRNEIMSLSSDETDQLLSPYTDRNLVSDWARPYMAYAVKHGIVLGTSEVKLGPGSPLDGLSFAAMILRQLGFKVDRTAFLSSLQILYEKGGINESEIELFNEPELLKNDAVGMAYTTLYAECSNGKPLIENLVRSGVVSEEKAFSQKLIRYNSPDSIETVNAQAPVIPRPTVYDQIYFIILDAMIQEDSSVKLPITPFTDTAKEVFDLIEKCVWDNPEILYYSGCTYSSTGLLTFKYSQDPETARNHKAVLEEKLNSIADQIILSDMTDYEKELAVHDYIINNCDYDTGSYQNGEIQSESFNAYGALCMNTAVCEGYAEAAKLLLNLAGVDCKIVIGSSRGEGHAWNIVKINDQNYHLDITWDDPVMTDGSKVLRYHYFNLTDQEMKMDHDWNMTEYPVCSSSEFNYYVYNKLIIPDEEEFVDFAVKKVKSGSNDVTVKFKNFKITDFDYEPAVRQVCNRLRLGCTASFNEVHGIVDLSFK